jgi:hypothetical protein
MDVTVNVRGIHERDTANRIGKMGILWVPPEDSLADEAVEWIQSKGYASSQTISWHWANPAVFASSTRLQ